MEIVILPAEVAEGLNMQRIFLQFIRSFAFPDLGPSEPKGEKIMVWKRASLIRWWFYGCGFFTEILAQENINEAIRVVGTHAAGGSGDLVMAGCSTVSQAALGVHCGHENMVGAGGNIARAYVYKQNRMDTRSLPANNLPCSVERSPRGKIREPEIYPCL